MLTTIIGVLIAFAIAFYRSGKKDIDDRDASDYIIPIFIGFIFSFILSFVLTFIFPKVNVGYTKQLESIQDGSNTNGTFFLGSGTINQRMQYVYYYQSENGLYRMNQVDYREASIRYSEEKPCVEILHKEFKANWAFYFALPCLGRDFYIFNIPKGSIQSNYKLDAL